MTAIEDPQVHDSINAQAKPRYRMTTQVIALKLLRIQITRQLLGNGEVGNPVVNR